MKPPERKKRLKYRVWKKRTNRITFMGCYEKELRRSRPRKAGCVYTYKRIDSDDGLIMTYSTKPKRNGCRRSTFRRAKWR